MSKRPWKNFLVVLICLAATAAVAAWLSYGFFPDTSEAADRQSEPRPGQQEEVPAAYPPPDNPTLNPSSDDKPVVAENPDDAWRLILASPRSPLGYDFTPPVLEAIADGFMVDARIAPPLRQMMEEARQEGISLMIISAYRPAHRQAELHGRQIERFLALGKSEQEAIAVASTIVLPPGTSEHQTGLAVDIVSPYYQALDDGFADTPAGIWLAENSWRYGFILRYPRDSIEITGVIFEPWHFRYVGREHAQAIFKGGYLLEEYLYDVLGIRQRTTSP